MDGQGLPPLGLRPIAPMPLVGVKGGVMGQLLLLLPPWGVFEGVNEGTQEPRRASGQPLDALLSAVCKEFICEGRRESALRGPVMSIW